MKYIVEQIMYDWGRTDLRIVEKENSNIKRTAKLLKGQLYRDVFDTLPEAQARYNKLLENPYELEV